MKQVKIICYFFLFVFVNISWGEIQYKPLFSMERHELSSGLSVNIKKWHKDQTEKFPIFFLKYSLYFPEVGQFFPDTYKHLFIPGLQTGFNLFKTKQKYDLCETGPGILPFTYHYGLKGKSAYFEFFQPFAEWGWAQSLCYSKNLSTTVKTKIKLRYYFSYGVFLSLKVLDRHSMYALDQDYGINDVGLRIECLHYDTTTNSSLQFCQIGLQLSF